MSETSSLNSRLEEQSSRIAELGKEVESVKTQVQSCVHFCRVGLASLPRALDELSRRIEALEEHKQASNRAKPAACSPREPAPAHSDKACPEVQEMVAHAERLAAAEVKLKTLGAGVETMLSKTDGAQAEERVVNAKHAEVKDTVVSAATFSTMANQVLAADETTLRQMLHRLISMDMPTVASSVQELQTHSDKMMKSVETSKSSLEFRMHHMQSRFKEWLAELKEAQIQHMECLFKDGLTELKDIVSTQVSAVIQKTAATTCRKIQTSVQQTIHIDTTSSAEDHLSPRLVSLCDADPGLQIRQKSDNASTSSTGLGTNQSIPSDCSDTMQGEQTTDPSSSAENILNKLIAHFRSDLQDRVNHVMLGALAPHAIASHRDSDDTASGAHAMPKTDLQQDQSLSDGAVCQSQPATEHVESEPNSAHASDRSKTVIKTSHLLKQLGVSGSSMKVPAPSQDAKPSSATQQTAVLGGSLRLVVPRDKSPKGPWPYTPGELLGGGSVKLVTLKEPFSNNARGRTPVSAMMSPDRQAREGGGNAMVQRSVSIGASQPAPKTNEVQRRISVGAPQSSPRDGSAEVHQRVTIATAQSAPRARSPLSSPQVNTRHLHMHAAASQSGDVTTSAVSSSARSCPPLRLVSMQMPRTKSNQEIATV